MTTRLPVPRDPYIAEFGLGASDEKVSMTASEKEEMRKRANMGADSPATKHRLSDFSKAFLDQEEEHSTVMTETTNLDFVDVHNPSKLRSQHVQKGKSCWSFMCDLLLVAALLLCIFGLTYGAVKANQPLTTVALEDGDMALMDPVSGQRVAVRVRANVVNFVPDGDSIRRLQKYQKKDPEKRKLVSLMHIGEAPRDEVLRAYEGLVNDRTPIMVHTKWRGYLYVRSMDLNQVDIQLTSDHPTETVISNIRMESDLTIEFKVACPIDKTQCNVYQIMEE